MSCKGRVEDCRTKNPEVNWGQLIDDLITVISISDYNDQIVKLLQTA